MRVRSNSNVLEAEISHEFRILSRAEQIELQGRFKKNEQGPGKGISFYDMVKHVGSNCHPKGRLN